MPEVVLDNVKQKVACGPCIRGHRSSTCAHKERVLIVVRKPGRPLSTCPHTAGSSSCNCARTVIYAVPNSPDCRCPKTGEPTFSSYTVIPGSSSISRRGHKNKVRGSKADTTSESINLEQSLEEPEFNSVLSGADGHITLSDSSNGHSLASSSSSTPQIDAVDFGSNLMQHDPFADVRLKAAERHQHNPLGLMDDFSISDHDVRLPTFPPFTIPNVAREQEDNVAVSSCCLGKQNPAQNAISTGLTHGRAFGEFGNSSDPFLTAPSTLAPNEGELASWFARVEARHGCHGTVPGHMANTAGAGCHCGENCNCLGCSTHPNNSTTQQYARFHDQIIHEQDFVAPQIISSPLYPQSLPFGGPPHANYPQLHSRDLSGGVHSQSTSQYPMGLYTDQGFSTVPGTQTNWAAQVPMEFNTSSSHPRGQNPIPMQQSYSRVHPGLNAQIHGQQEASAASIENGVPSGTSRFELGLRTLGDRGLPMDHESSSTEDDASTMTMSPSSYNVHTFAYSQCNGNGNCQCSNCQCRRD
ncbi:hypothetical protein EJ08DRAFT_114393 [Tothia fuscella]|uniref:Copper-fist domain-containing protein n=1 Tax=Tothia fuscella TaxID=1048955 RepID=A0A9P4NX36_9PEZI|nr:hypothetical protein EJ08DRAFT_114393 [Tothia fuscella]